MSLQRVLLFPDPPEEGSPPVEDELVRIPRKELEELRAKASASIIDSAESELVAPRYVDRTSTRDEDRFSDDSTRGGDREVALERAYRNALLEKELVTALSDRTLVPGAVSQLVKLWRDDFDVYEDDGTIKIASRDGRTLNEIVNERLADPAYSHFRKANARGGTKSNGTGYPSGVPSQVGPKSLGDSILNQWLEANSAQTHPARTGWGRLR